MNGQAVDFIADTSAVVRLLRRDSDVEDKVRDKIFAVTFVTIAELDVGILKATDPVAAGQRCAEVLADVLVCNSSGSTPMFYARIYHDLEQRGKRIPINDIWIAAIAIELGLPVLARDEHFSRVQGLSVVQC
jgi:tRNA(fMet)-specific endonuclease VapC